MRLVAWILGLSLLIGAAAPALHAQNLSGMQSDEIAALQQRLTADGCYHGAIDGQASPALEAAIKACPSQQPVLRIETGMHIAAIKSIGVDRACRIAATTSDDRTVRVWSLPQARLLRTLRVPIGSGNGGRMDATAVSPDGRWVAVGGWDADWDARHEMYVYVFDTSTGKLAARSGPFGNTIKHLAFSPDGRWLAVTRWLAPASGHGVGLKVIDTQTWRIVASDSDYRGPSFGAAFAPDGRLYTVAFDGKLRQYGPGPAFKKEREVATRGGTEPFSVAVDPRGQLIAVGFHDSTKVDLYDAKTLAFRSAADTNGINNGDLSRVAWSSDGTRLVSAGRYRARFQGKRETPLLTFSRTGRRIGTPLPLSDNAIMDLQPCGDAVAVAANDPAFGLVDRRDRIKLWKTGVAPDMRGKLGSAFMIAPDAGQVRFGLGAGEVEPVLFNLGEATVTEAPNPPANFLAPFTYGLPVASWHNKDHPTFAGRPLRFHPYEHSRSLAIRPDRRGFVLGTSRGLRAFNANGRQRWLRLGPGVAWGVNFSADGRIIVVAYDDGTIRWRRWKDGKELLALFVDRKTRAWVAWTPSGYYMASPGGEDLIGWHLNRGWSQAADFFPASRFRDRFNRPDIVRLVLATLDEDEAVKQANAAARRKTDTQPLIGHLPPIIRIVDPADGSHFADNTVRLDYALRSPSGQPVNRLDVLMDGRPVRTLALPIHPLLPNAESHGSIQVTLTQHVTNVGLIAWSGKLASQAVHVKVTWDGAPEATRKLYALVIGVSHYDDRNLKLDYAAKDARDFAEVLRGQKGHYYADVETRVLTDHEVTRASVIAGLEWLEKVATNPDDVSVLFLAGHGITDPHQTYWFYTADSNDDDVHIRGVSQDEIREALQSLRGKVLWFLDTCHAGAVAKRSPVDINVLVNTVSASENGGIVVFASSTGRQVSVESKGLGNGVFTKAVVEGIAQGKADLLGEGLITTSSLDTYVVHRVAQLTDHKQTPVMERPPQEPDFAIATVPKRPPPGG